MENISNDRFIPSKSALGALALSAAFLASSTAQAEDPVDAATKVDVAVVQGKACLDACHEKSAADALAGVAADVATRSFDACERACLRTTAENCDPTAKPADTADAAKDPLKAVEKHVEGGESGTTTVAKRTTTKKVAKVAAGGQPVTQEVDVNTGDTQVTVNIYGNDSKNAEGEKNEDAKTEEVKTDENSSHPQVSDDIDGGFQPTVEGDSYFFAGPRADFYPADDGNPLSVGGQLGVGMPINDRFGVEIGGDMAGGSGITGEGSKDAAIYGALLRGTMNLGDNARLAAGLHARFADGDIPVAFTTVDISASVHKALSNWFGVYLQGDVGGSNQNDEGAPSGLHIGGSAGLTFNLDATSTERTKKKRDRKRSR